MKIAMKTCALLFVSFSLFGTTYYVDDDIGLDTNAGLTPSTAYKTLQFAVDFGLLPGDSIVVADGDYEGFDYRSYWFGVSGTVANPIVFYANGNDVNIVSGSGKVGTRADGINIEGEQVDPLAYIEINGFNVVGLGDPGNGIRLVWANNCIVRNCTLDGNQRGVFTGFTNDLLVEYNTCINSTDEHGVYVSNSSDDAVVRYNIIYNNNNIGIHMNGDASQSGGDGINHTPLIYGNLIYDNNLAAGINLDGVLNPIIYNNLIYNNHSGQGIVMFQGDGAIVTREAKIFNNTIIVPTDGRWGILVREGGNIGTEIKNNIILTQHSSRGIIALWDTTGFISDFNILQDRLNIDNEDNIPAGTFANWQSNNLDLNSQIIGLDNTSISSLFVDFGAFDFHLSSGAIAKDAGTVTPYALDFDNIIRPQDASFDIGAYEATSTLAVDDVSSFRISKLGDQALLNWRAYDAQNISFFRIEKSRDGATWEKIDEVKTKDNLDIYSYLDNHTFEGSSYYRVISINKDGIKYPSQILAIDFTLSDGNTTIFPNPSNGIVNVVSDRDITKIELYDYSGKLLKVFNGLRQIDLSENMHGIYILKLYDNQKVSEQKIIIF